MASHLKGGASPAAMHQERQAEAASRLAELESRMPVAPRTELRQRVRLAQRYARFREDGKHCLMLGYDLLRDMALDAGRRLGIGDDVFLLDSEELQQALAAGACAPAPARRTPP